MRLASLHPAVTEWVCAFGAEAGLVARSHDSDFPPAIQALRVVTRPLPGPVPDGEARCLLDSEALYQARPDLVLTWAQTLHGGLPPELFNTLPATVDGPPPAVWSMALSTLKQVLDAALQLAARIGRLPTAMQVLGEGEARLQKLWNGLGLTKRSDERTFPSVVCLSRLDPLVVAGRWVPEMVEKGGGRALCTTPGQASASITPEALHAADPDVVVVLENVAPTPDGFPQRVPLQGWEHLRAVRNGRVWRFDAQAGFNRPGPRLYHTIESLAHVLYPDDR